MKKCTRNVPDLLFFCHFHAEIVKFGQILTHLSLNGGGERKYGEGANALCGATKFSGNFEQIFLDCRKFVLYKRIGKYTFLGKLKAFQEILTNVTCICTGFYTHELLIK